MNDIRLVGLACAWLLAGALAACGGSSSDEETGSPKLATNGNIVYQDDGQQTWTMHPDGSKKHLLVKTGTQAGISPNGRRITYVYGVLDKSIDNYVPKLWVMNADGTGKGHFDLAVNPSSVGAHPDWSPDGKTIVFSGSRGEEIDHIYTVKPDGTGLKQLTAGGDSDPVWSPDGKTIGFVRLDLDKEPIAFSVYAMNADGSAQRKLADGSDPNWSPDGEQIVFDSSRGIEAVNADGSERRTLLGGLVVMPALSPDGKKLTYAAGEVGEPANGIYVMNVEGSGKQQITHLGFGRVDRIIWQPRRGVR